MIICCVRKPLICQLPCTGVVSEHICAGEPVSETAPSMGTLCKRYRVELAAEYAMFIAEIIS